MIYLDQNFNMLYLGCFTINRDSEQNDKVSHRKAFGFKKHVRACAQFCLGQEIFDIHPI